MSDSIIKKFKILQDYRTLERSIPKYTIGELRRFDNKVRFIDVEGYYVDFALTDVLGESDWFEEVPLDHEETPEFKVGDVVKFKDKQCLILCKYFSIYEGQMYKLGDGSTLTQEALIQLCSKTQS